MVDVFFESLFERRFKKIKDKFLKMKINKGLSKVINGPKIGKPMKYSRKGTREIYISPFRLSYLYIEEENKIIFLDLYHKDEQ